MVVCGSFSINNLRPSNEAVSTWPCFPLPVHNARQKRGALILDRNRTKDMTSRWFSFHCLVKVDYRIEMWISIIGGHVIEVQPDNPAKSNFTQFGKPLTLHKLTTLIVKVFLFLEIESSLKSSPGNFGARFRQARWETIQKSATSNLYPHPNLASANIRRQSCTH